MGGTVCIGKLGQAARPHADICLIIVWMYSRCSESQNIREAGTGDLEGSERVCLIGAKRVARNRRGTEVTTGS